MTADSNRKLLLPVDGSIDAERAAQYLVHYAAALGESETIVLHVRPADSIPIHAADGSEIKFDLHEVGMNATRRVRDILDAARVRYRSDTQVGDPVDVIAYSAQTERVDEIVMASRGLGQWEGLVLGSVAYKVIHRVAVPVTVVGPLDSDAPPPAAKLGTVHRVLLAVDGSKHALRAADYICQLHKLGMPMEVELVNAPAPIPAGYVGRFITDEIIKGYYSEESVPALRDAQEALQSAGVHFNTHVVAGHAVEEIVHAAREHRCSRIVMGTRGLGAVAGLMLGSVAYQVIHLSPIPVTLVK